MANVRVKNRQSFLSFYPSGGTEIELTEYYALFKTIGFSRIYKTILVLKKAFVIHIDVRLRKLRYQLSQLQPKANYQSKIDSYLRMRKTWRSNVEARVARLHENFRPNRHQCRQENKENKWQIQRKTMSIVNSLA